MADATGFGNCPGCSRPMRGVQKVFLFRHPETRVLTALCFECYEKGESYKLERQGYLMMQSE